MNPQRNGRVALRYAVLCAPLCVGLWYAGVTDSGFLVTSGVANAWLIQRAWRFWREEGGRGSARGLFWASVWHLPVVMVLAMLQKKGLWERVWMGLTGEGTEDDGEDEEDDDDDDDGEDGLPQPLPLPIVPGIAREGTR
jgi:protoheme IX farnesyltransferase